MSNDNETLKIVDFVDDYLSEGTWMIKENSNTNFSFAGLQGYIASEVMKKYALTTMYEGEISKAHSDGFLHIHDLSHAIVPYCAGYGTQLLMEEGFNAGPNFIYSNPPNHLDALLGQINNFIFTMSGEWAGAQAMNSLDTYCAAFIKKDNMTYKEVYRDIRQLVYNLNIKTRLAMQSPFTNFSIDLTVPSDMKDEDVVIAGKTLDFKYGDLQEEMDMFNEALIDVMMEGDSMNKIFTFPILTYGITPEFEWDSPLAEKIFTFADECNSPYFSNFLNSDQNPEDIRSMCLSYDTKITVLGKPSPAKRGPRKGQLITRRPLVVELGDFVTNYNYKDYQVRTSQGFRNIERTIEVDVSELRRVIFSNGSELTMSLDHPHLVYDEDDNLQIVAAKDLKVGMRSSYLTRLGESMIGNSYKSNHVVIHKDDKITSVLPDLVDDYISKGWVVGEPEWRSEKKSEYMSGSSNPMSGKVHTDETKSKISETLKSYDGSHIPQSHRDSSSSRWKGLDNPISSQEYWDRQVSSKGDECVVIPPLEYIITDYLDGAGIEYVHQKVFNDQLNDKTYVVDLYLPSQDLVIEVESSSDGCYINEGIDSTRLSYLQELGFDVVVTNPTVSDKWMTYLNKVVSIVDIIDYKEDSTVYDLEISEEGYDTVVHDFYANDILTHNCCRLRLDLSELINNSGGLFGSGDSTGSIGVVTLNLSKIGYVSRLLSTGYSTLTDEKDKVDYKTSLNLLKNYPELSARVDNLMKQVDKSLVSNGDVKFRIYFMLIDYFMVLSRKSLLIKRKVCQDYMDSGLTPYTKRYLGNLDSHFNTLGVNGGHEMCLNMLGEGIESEEGLKLAEKTLIHMIDKLGKYQEEDVGLLYNLEATPAEGAGTRFAKKDRETFKNIITGSGTNAEFYTNSTQVPEDYSDNIFDVFENQQYLQPLYTSGTVQHIYMNEPTKNWRVVQSLVKKLFTNYKLPYISISPDVCICPLCGRLDGTYEYCPKEHTKEDLENAMDRGIIKMNEDGIYTL